MNDSAIRQEEPRASLDMAPQIRSLRDLVRSWLAAHVHRPMPMSRMELDPASVARKAGLSPKGMGKPEVILAGDVAVELGAPSTASHTAVLLTQQRDLVQHGTVWRFGPDLDGVPKGSSLPFAQILIVAVDGEAWPDPFALDSAQYLPHRLPGYMTRSIPGRLWVRVSDSARARRLTLSQVGAALMTAMQESVPGISATEVLFATAPDVVGSLAPLCLEADIVAGRHRKLAISESGELDCAELACDECVEKPVCDGLRDMLAQRRRST